MLHLHMPLKLFLWFPLPSFLQLRTEQKNAGRSYVELPDAVAAAAVIMGLFCGLLFNAPCNDDRGTQAASCESSATYHFHIHHPLLFLSICGALEKKLRLLPSILAVLFAHPEGPHLKSHFHSVRPSVRQAHLHFPPACPLQPTVFLSFPPPLSSSSDDFIR